MIFKLKQLFVCAALSLIALVGHAQTTTPIYLDDKHPMEARVEDALSRMTLKEKIAMVHAQSKFSSPGCPRLGIPENWMTDGPHGIRAEVLWDEWFGASWTNDSCFAFPALTSLAATWDPKLAYLYGKSIGEEARYRNKNVLLGPGVNIYRTPLNGRNFEYMGEDPFLASTMVVPYIQGVQSNGVAACVKHFALNNQEIDRGKINVIVDERTLREIYLPAFKAAVQQGHAWAIMGSYNQYKKQHCCHNEYLLNDILKGEWGFDGVVISDWGGVHDTEQAAKNGLDMEFGSWTNGLNWGASNAYDHYYMAVPYLKAIQEGTLGTKELDDKVRRILRLSFRTTMNRHRPYGSFVTPAHAKAGLDIAANGMVLLKNDKQLLPLNLKTGKQRILVVGENAIKRMTIGGGSSSLKVKYEVSPLAGIKAIMPDTTLLSYARGYASPAVAEQDVKGAVASTQKFDNQALHDEAIAAAKEADVVIFVGGLNKNDGQDCEGNDRQSLGLPYNQDQLIADLTQANKHTVVVLVTGNAVAMPWVHKVPAILQAWYAGSEAGNALAAVLSGEVNPSGKLPFTFPVSLDEVGAHALGEYPGDGVDVHYTEGFNVGYRYNDSKHIKPLFAFGYGLSYTTFKVDQVTLSDKTLTEGGTIQLTARVTNTGKRAGQEVVQLYIQDDVCSLYRPEKELKGFTKVALAPGESKTITFDINKSMLTFYDDKAHAWTAEAGTFHAVVATSAEDIVARKKFIYK